MGARASRGHRRASSLQARRLCADPKPSAALTGTWNQFVRVYAPDLSSLLYSSLITGAWDAATGAGGDNTRLIGLALRADAVLVAGWHEASSPGAAEGQPVPTRQAPAWARTQPIGETALFARLSGERLGGTEAPGATRVFANGFE